MNGLYFALSVIAGALTLAAYNLGRIAAALEQRNERTDDDDAPGAEPAGTPAPTQPTPPPRTVVAVNNETEARAIARRRTWRNDIVQIVRRNRGTNHV